MLKHHLSVFVLAMISMPVLVGCGKEQGRVPFAGEGSHAATIPLEAGDVAFWTDIDLKYEGEAALTYHIDLLQGGSSVATAECEALGPMSMKVGWVETRVNSARSRSGRGKMECSARISKSGPTLVQATLAFSTRPGRATLGRADLVVKQ
jgi:hypothetical protein